MAGSEEPHRGCKFARPSARLRFILVAGRGGTLRTGAALYPRLENLQGGSRGGLGIPSMGKRASVGATVASVGAAARCRMLPIRSHARLLRLANKAVCSVSLPLSCDAGSAQKHRLVRTKSADCKLGGFSVTSDRRFVLRPASLGGCPLMDGFCPARKGFSDECALGCRSKGHGFAQGEWCDLALC